MAKRKTKSAAAKAFTKPGKKNLIPKTHGGVPDGFQLPATANVPNWDFEKHNVLQGDVVQIKNITLKNAKKGQKKTTRLMIVREDDTGKLLQVWESTGLSGLFEEVKKDYAVYIEYSGLGPKVKGKNQMRLFETGYKK